MPQSSASYKRRQRSTAGAWLGVVVVLAYRFPPAPHIGDLGAGQVVVLFQNLRPVWAHGEPARCLCRDSCALDDGATREHVWVHFDMSKLTSGPTATSERHTGQRTLVRTGGLDAQRPRPKGGTSLARLTPEEVQVGLASMP